MATRHTGAGKFCDVTARPLAQLVHPSWSAALAPLRAKAEADGRGDYSPLWAGQGVALVDAAPAIEITQRLGQAALIEA